MEGTKKVLVPGQFSTILEIPEFAAVLNGRMAELLPVYKAMKQEELIIAVTEKHALIDSISVFCNSLFEANAALASAIADIAKAAKCVADGSPLDEQTKKRLDELAALSAVGE